jgi:hypothetical protein
MLDHIPVSPGFQNTTAFLVHISPILDASTIPFHDVTTIRGCSVEADTRLRMPVKASFAFW